MSNTRYAIALLCASFSLFAAACSSPAPKPLPGGPPPEYEKPRSYAGNLGDAPPAAEPKNEDAPAAPTPAVAPPAASSAPAAPSASAPAKP